LVAFYVALLAILMACLLGITGGCLRKPGATKLSACLTVNFGVLVWCLAGAHLIASIMTGDYCIRSESFITSWESCNSYNMGQITQDELTVDCSLPEYSPLSGVFDNIVPCERADTNAMFSQQWEALSILLYARSSIGTYDSLILPTNPADQSIRGVLTKCSYGTGVENVGKYRSNSSFADPSAVVYGKGDLSTYIDISTMGSELKEFVSTQMGSGLCIAISTTVVELFPSLVDAYNGEFVRRSLAHIYI
jgi:hypothetical protein